MSFSIVNFLTVLLEVYFLLGISQCMEGGCGILGALSLLNHVPK